MGSGGAPVEANGSSPSGGGGYAEEQDQTKIWRHCFWGQKQGVVSLRILLRVCVSCFVVCGV